MTKASSPTSYDLWLVDLQRPVATRLTFDGLVAGAGGTSAYAVWSPDGRRAAYMYDRSDVYDVYQVLASGTGRSEPLVQSTVIFKIPVARSPDGKYFVFTQNDEGSYDLWLLPLQGDRTPLSYLRTPFNENTAAISPDGRWLAYDSNETGTSEIYVRSFPEPGEKYRISIAGGTRAQWSKDGSALIIWTSAQIFPSVVGQVFSVDVQTTPAFKAGTPRSLARHRPSSGTVATS